MKQITLRLPEDLLEELEEEAEEHDVSRSEHIRNVLESRENTDRLRSRIETLEDQLRERSRVEEKIEDLPDKLRDVESYTEQRQRKLDRAGFAQRFKWKITGVPVDDDAVEK